MTYFSGLLVTYLWFKVMKRRGGKDIKSPGFWANFYFHRYIRLVYSSMEVYYVNNTRDNIIHS